MSLADAVSLAVRNSKIITAAYLDRIAQQYDLKVAEDKFTPKPVLSSTAQKNVLKTNGIRTDDKNATVTGTITELVPTGGQLNLTGSGSYDNLNNEETRTGAWNVMFSQPLLKGGGIDVTTASVRIARNNENVNVLALKSTIMDTVTSVIVAYRNLLLTGRQLEIAKQSLERAKELVAINRELISAGRMAEVEIIQAEADLSGKEFDLVSAENNVDAARLSLIKLLDIDKHTMIVPTEQIGIGQAVPGYQAAKALAFANRPDYLSALLGVESSKINVTVAKNNKLWDLSAFGSYGGGHISGDGENTKSWSTGLTLVIPLHDLTLEQGYVSAKVDFEKKEVGLNKLHDDIEIDVQDAIRDAQMKMRQLGLAQQARSLSEKKLAIETEKMKAGRSTNFQLVSYQNDLVNAQNNEVSAIITYLDALTSLDRTVGTTLEKWDIKIEERH